MRFTIRDLLWLTVVIALAMAWWVDRKRIGAAFGFRNTGMEAALVSWGWRVEQSSDTITIRNVKTGEVGYVYSREP